MITGQIPSCSEYQRQRESRYAVVMYRISGYVWPIPCALWVGDAVRAERICQRLRRADRLHHPVGMCLYFVKRLGDGMLIQEAS